jgi:tetratricopeptide (TPR) repeat protein
MADAAVLLDSASELCATRRCGEAVALWEQASSLRPADPGVHYQLGFCYAGGCGARALLDPAIAIFHYRRALALSAKATAVGRAMVLGALGNAYASAAGRSRPQLMNAIRCYEEAAEIYAGARKLDDWAREQFNLGNVWCEMPEADFPEKWQRAIEHYERALPVRTRTNDARHYAATLQNLGTAYREVKSGDPHANVRKAIDCYHRAIRALRNVAPARKRADLHHNLGNAFLSLSAMEAFEDRNVLRALRHFARALSARTKEESPFDYAATQFSRGQAFVRLAARGVGGAHSLDQARVCFAEAIKAFLISGQPDLADEVKKRFDLLAPADKHASRELHLAGTK